MSYKSEAKLPNYSFPINKTVKVLVLAQMGMRVFVCNSVQFLSCRRMYRVLISLKGGFEEPALATFIACGNIIAANRGKLLQLEPVVLYYLL